MNRPVTLPEESSADIVAVAHSFNKVVNHVVMVGHNIGPDGRPKDKAKPMVCWQCEYSYAVKEPDGSITLLHEINEDRHQEGQAPVRWRCTKVDATDPRKFVDQRFHIAGNGRFSIATLSDIDTAGKFCSGHDAYGNTFTTHGWFFVVEGSQGQEAHIPFGELRCESFEKSGQAVVEHGNRGHADHFNGPVKFNGPVEFTQGINDEFISGKFRYVVRGGVIVEKIRR